MNKVNNKLEKSTKGRKMTLKGYYEELPGLQSPKSAFINEVVARTGVSIQTARNWVIYGMKPMNKEHVSVLVELTGIPAEELW